MSYDQVLAYSEVSSFILSIDAKHRNMIPEKVHVFLWRNSDINKIKKYNLDIPLSEQNISRKALSIIALLHLNYWCEDEDEKKSLEKLFYQNSRLVEEEKRDKYNPDDIFGKKD